MQRLRLPAQCKAVNTHRDQEFPPRGRRGRDRAGRLGGNKGVAEDLRTHREGWAERAGERDLAGTARFKKLEQWGHEVLSERRYCKTREGGSLPDLCSAEHGLCVGRTDFLHLFTRDPQFLSVSY